MSKVLILLDDTPDGVDVHIEIVPPPDTNPTPAQRVAAELQRHLISTFGATDEPAQPE